MRSQHSQVHCKPFTCLMILIHFLTQGHERIIKRQNICYTVAIEHTATVNDIQTATHTNTTLWYIYVFTLHFFYSPFIFP